MIVCGPHSIGLDIVKKRKVYVKKCYIRKAKFQKKLGNNKHVGEHMGPQNEVGYGSRFVNDYTYVKTAPPLCLLLCFKSPHQTPK